MYGKASLGMPLPLSATETPTPDEAGLTLPTKDDGRWPVLYEAARIAKPQLDEMDCVMMGLFCG